MIAIENNRIAIPLADIPDAATLARISRMPGALHQRSKLRWTLPASPRSAHLLSTALAVTDLLALDPLLTIYRKQRDLLGPESRLSDHWTGDYEPLIPMRRSQHEGINLIKALPSVLLEHGMGVGKTAQAWHAIAQLPEVRRVLIVTKKAVIPHWPNQCGAHLPGVASEWFRVISPTKGSTSKKSKDIALRWVPGEPDAGVVVAVVGYASVWRGDLGKLFLDHPPDMIVLDEIQNIKAPGGKCSKYMARLGPLAKKRVGLSGTPLPHSHEDAYGLFRFLDPGLYGTSFGAFRARYSETVEMGIGRNVTVGTRNEEEFNRLYYSITHKVDADDVLELPGVQHIELDVEMPPKSWRIYSGLRDELVAEISDGQWVDVNNALTKTLRLQQITSGYLGSDEGITELHTAKTESLAAWLDGVGPEPTVVWCHFVWELQQVHKAAKTAGRPSFELSGRANGMVGWKSCDDGVLAVQIQAGCEGIELTEARYACYFSHMHSLGMTEQSYARLNRPGQKHKVSFYHLIVRGSIDEAVRRAHRKRRDVLDFLLRKDW